MTMCYRCLHECTDWAPCRCLGCPRVVATITTTGTTIPSCEKCGKVVRTDVNRHACNIGVVP